MRISTTTTVSRLDERTSQGVFRVLLDTLARPGTPGRLPHAGTCPAVLLPVFALADVEVLVAFDGGTEEWADALRVATGAATAAWEDADISVALDPPAPGAVLRLRRGSASEPEAGTRLCLACRSLDLSGRQTQAATAPVSRLSLRGPGIEGERRLAVAGIDPAVFRELAHANAAFPEGIDTHVVADDGVVVSIPRSTTIVVDADDATGKA